jgi:AraC family transcriptional regulator
MTRAESSATIRRMLPASDLLFSPASEAFTAEAIGASVASQYGAHGALSRLSDGIVVTSVSADLSDWQPLRSPALHEGLQLTVDMRPGGWRRGAEGSVGGLPYATHANGLALSALDPPTAEWARGRFDVLTLVLRRATLDAFADEAGVPRRTALACTPGTVDPVIGGMACTLAGALRESPESTALYFAPLVRAVIGRVLTAHVRDGSSEARGSGALAPWQERKAKALLAARMATDISVTEVARECRLSRSHFCKAFKQTTGQSPYAWLTRYRITTAQSLLRSTSQPLADIALACGFGDQSHLTRMFSRVVGTPPGSWRRTLAR